MVRLAFASGRVFVDSSAYYAVTDPRDDNHARARSIALALSRERRPLFTSNFVLAETHTLTLSHPGHSVALRVLTEILASSTTIVRVSAADERRAQAIIVQYTDKDFSYTDATSFAIMERLHIRSVFTFDDDFTRFGLNPVTPQSIREG
jgi:predicted nucleic acid-binding protein